MSRKNVRKTLNPVEVLIVDDLLERLGCLIETVAETGNKAKYANSYESAIDGRVAYYDIVACDVILHEHDPKKGTGFDFRQSYLKIHKNTIFLMYSGNKELIDESKQSEVLDTMEIQDALLDAIDMVDKRKSASYGLKEEVVSMGDIYNKEACNERHNNLQLMMVRIDKNIDKLYSRLNWFYVIAIITLASTVSSIIIPWH